MFVFSGTFLITNLIHGSVSLSIVALIGDVDAAQLTQEVITPIAGDLDWP
jgi:hypothetical protein